MLFERCSPTITIPVTPDRDDRIRVPTGDGMLHELGVKQEVGQCVDVTETK